MANRDELAVIRNARAGDANAQLALARLYLEGSASLAQNRVTALHWLNRAAQNGLDAAWLLIGEAIPLEAVWQSEAPLQMAQWYFRAWQAGVMPAGLVYAQIVLGQGGERPDSARRQQALAVLQAVARAGVAQAQWLLAQQQLPVADNGDDESALLWTERAAQAGVAQAQQALMQQLWERADYAAYLHWAVPLAQQVVRQLQSENCSADDAQLNLLIRSAQAMSRLDAAMLSGLPHPPQPNDQQVFWEMAALHGAREAQLWVGLMYARMDAAGTRIAGGSANFKKAVRWLNLAGEQGLAEAWFALARIYARPEFSQRNVAAAQSYLERAASLGHAQAQWECGNLAWRNRREQPGNDVKAVLWLHQAQLQGMAQAQRLLEKIAPVVPAQPWALQAKALLSRSMIGSHPLLVARLELAWLFGLARAEALLLDVHQADQGHCLVVDVRAHYGRSKRRLILLRNGQERQLLDRVARVFMDVDCSPDGPEGNYRQRLYRLKALLPQLAADELAEAA